MVNTLSILIAHAVLIYIAARALLLDSQLPWFETDQEEAERTGKGKNPEPVPQRRGGLH